MTARPRKTESHAERVDRLVAELAAISSQLEQTDRTRIRRAMNGNAS